MTTRSSVRCTGNRPVPSIGLAGSLALLPLVVPLPMSSVSSSKTSTPRPPSRSEEHPPSVVLTPVSSASCSPLWHLLCGWPARVMTPSILQRTMHSSTIQRALH